MERYCSRCRAKVVEKDNFCPKCGEKIVEETKSVQEEKNLLEG